MRKVLLSAVAAVALAATPALAQQKVKIGFITTFTGPNAVIGEDMRNSVEVALDHLGRKMGGLDVEVIYEDDQQKPEVGKQKAEKLVQSDKVNFTSGIIWSNVLLASIKSIADAETFHIGANAGPSQLAGEQCSPFFFTTSWQNDQTPMAMGETLNQRGMKKLYVIAPNYPAGRDMAAGVKRVFKGELVGEDYTKWPEQLDFSAELSKARAARPDAVFVFFPGGAGVQFLAQYVQSGMNKVAPLMQAFTIDATTLPQQGEAALGAYGTQSWVHDLPNDTNKKFVADYKKKFGNKYPSYYGAQSYDAIMLIDSAVRATKGDLADKNAVRAALRKADAPNTRGKFKFNTNHFPIQDFYLQQVVKDAEGQLTMKTLSKVFEDHKDPYYEKCSMKW